MVALKSNAQCVPWLWSDVGFVDIMVVYMCSSLLQLAPVSRDLSQAEKRITLAAAPYPVRPARPRPYLDFEK